MREVSISYRNISGAEILYLLERDLEIEDKYNVSRTDDALVVASDIYKQSRRKGFLGWFGSVWDERVIFTISPIPEETIEERLNSLGEAEILRLYNGPARIVVNAQAYERQNDDFEWKEIELDDPKQNVKQNFFSEIRELIRTYEHSKSEGNTST